MAFVYSLFLKLFYPTSVALMLLLASACLRKRQRLSRIFCWLGIAVIFVCGNGWLVGALTKNLEWRNLPPNPVPEADAIVVLSGGIRGRVPPRPTVEVSDGGDRVIYGAYLYRQHKAPRIICTGNVATGGVAPRPAALDMAEFLEMVGVGAEAIITEIASENTHEHAKNLRAVFQKQGIKRVLLVTSAMHMPRSVATFRRLCPEVQFTPAPTDFHCTQASPTAWYRKLTGFIPTPSHLLAFSAVMHEYLGIAWYKFKGWA